MMKILEKFKVWIGKNNDNTSINRYVRNLKDIRNGMLKSSIVISTRVFNDNKAYLFFSNENVKFYIEHNYLNTIDIFEVKECSINKLINVLNEFINFIKKKRNKVETLRFNEVVYDGLKETLEKYIAFLKYLEKKHILDSCDDNYIILQEVTTAINEFGIPISGDSVLLDILKGINLNQEIPYSHVDIDNTIGHLMSDPQKYDDNIETLKYLIKLSKICSNLKNQYLPKRKTSKNDNLSIYTNLLLNNKNLILTGAPGTGKTYLAKKIIAKEITDKEENIAFVQFHPSYDYTDFVEGLRPVKKGDDLGFELKNGIFKDFCKKAKDNPNEKFVFIIDEINRAEVSKVFGELFFSIDPGYRGTNGKVKTQYSNIQTEATYFTDEKDDYFYVPDNVYIIGTMNDIDRSVESFDFAMRRRFAWKEIKAKDQITMWNGVLDAKTIVIATKKMKKLNKAIKKAEGLSSAYHIGPAYFLKLKQYDGNFNKLWNYHIKNLLYEYLRGRPDVDDLIKELELAYGYKPKQ